MFTVFTIVFTEYLRLCLQRGESLQCLRSCLQRGLSLEGLRSCLQSVYRVFTIVFTER